MIDLNRIKCAATRTAGVLAFGAAMPGYRTMPTWTGGDNLHFPYLLENAAGEWEAGYMTIGPTPTNTQSYTPENQSAGVLGDVGLTFSVPATAASVLAGGIGIGSTGPMAPLNSLAAGRNAFVGNDAGGAIAVGDSAQATATDGIAIGKLTTAGIAGIGGLPTVGQGAIAIGSGAAANARNSVALGANTGATAASAVALGDGVWALNPSEVAFGGSTVACKRFFPIYWHGNSVSSGSQFLMPDGTALLLAQTGAFNKSGIVRIQGMITSGTVTAGVQTDYRSFNLDYHVFISSANAVTVLGTPTITAVYAGGTAPAATITIGASGVPLLTTASATVQVAYGLLEMTDTRMGSLF
jgi:hypothetical protein